MTDPLPRLAATLRQALSHRRGDADPRLTRWATDPVGFVTTVLREHLWSRQQEIARSLVHQRRVAVPSCHGAGKSFLASRLVAWWVATRPADEVFVVTSAPTFAQVRAILWREIARAHARGRLPGTLSQTEWRIGRRLVGFGRKPADTDGTAFQGIHARHVLVVFDEACGIPKPLWDAAETLLTTPQARFLAIGNPDDPLSAFAGVCAEESGWCVLPIDAHATPDFTGEVVPKALAPLLVSRLWAEEMAARWGEGSALWQAKVRGRFPDVAADALLAPAVLERARRAALLPGLPIELGVDVARFGPDASVIAVRRGAVGRIVGVHHGLDIPGLAAAVRTAMAETTATAIKVDEIGLGAGLVDVLRASGLPVTGINVARAAQASDRFVNRRAELWWRLRERAEAGDLDLPDDDSLIAEMARLRWGLDGRGRIALEAKAAARAELGRSPDRADALLLAFADADRPVAAWNAW
ncbi:MAG: hypothetical protein EAZ99_07420 [Alphaproteobacteria bacterium]|nr:MAG: hypothetical protein EAZ99_07420 [Alphaproteobacteria bacterium]